MTTTTASWLRRCPDLDGDTTPPQSDLPTRDYPHTYVMGAQANRSRKRINYTSVFCAFVFVLWALAMIF